jgi:hypothetical protein
MSAECHVIDMKEKPNKKAGIFAGLFCNTPYN